MWHQPLQPDSTLTKAHTPGKKGNQHRSAAVSPWALPHNQKQPTSRKAPAPAPQPQQGGDGHWTQKKPLLASDSGLSPSSSNPVAHQDRGCQPSLGKTWHVLTSDLTLPSKPLVTGRLHRTLVHCWGDVNWCNLCRKQYEVSSKNQKQNYRLSRILLLARHPKKAKTLIWKYGCTLIAHSSITYNSQDRQTI